MQLAWWNDIYSYLMQLFTDILKREEVFPPKVKRKVGRPPKEEGKLATKPKRDYFSRPPPKEKTMTLHRYL